MSGVLETLRGPEKRIIRWAAGERHTVVEQLGEVISDKLPVYTHGNCLVRIGEASELEGSAIKRELSQRSMVPVSAEWLCLTLPGYVTLQRYDGRKEEWKDVDLPVDLANLILKRGSWPRISPLVAIMRAPFVREDGSICERPGYDTDSAAYYVPNADFPQLPLEVSRDDARSALDTLLEPFDEFPYATPAARSAFAAHILTEAARLAVDFSPMFWYTAPDAGTGKTLLSEIAATIVHGHMPARRPWPKDASDEMRKTLFASLLAGDRSIMFDNIQNGYKARSAELCAFLTSQLWQDRKLGESSAPTVANMAVVSGSGNNVTPVSDMARRSLVVRLDPNTPNAKARRFKIGNLRAYVLAHRVELLIAALTVIQGYRQSGWTDAPAPLPSFEDWSERVRDPLLWLGMANPADTQDQETDDEAGQADAVFELLAPTFADKPFTAADVARLAAIDERLNSAMLEGGCEEPFSSKKVGFWLRDQRDRFGAGYKLIKARTAHHTSYWAFERREVPRISNADNMAYCGNADLA